MNLCLFYKNFHVSAPHVSGPQMFRFVRVVECIYSFVFLRACSKHRLVKVRLYRNKEGGEANKHVTTRVLHHQGAYAGP